MTCIVGVIDKANSRVFIGGDSAATRWSEISIRKDPKVFQVGEFTIGCIGSPRMSQLLRFKLSLPRIHDTDIFEYMCTSFIDAVKECFNDNGFKKSGEEGEEKGGEFMVGYKDRLFIIYSDFQVEENFREFTAIGSGGDIASGALYVLQSGTPNTVSNIEQALQAASELCNDVAPPFNILKTI